MSAASPGDAPRGPAGLNRRLAAVLFADVVGYTELSGRDAPAALRLVALLQETAAREVAAAEGRIVKFIGDAVLAVFPSAEAAVRCAIRLESAFREETSGTGTAGTLRAGVHIGEIVEAEDGDVYGNGVNISARLQAAAEPRAVLVSEDVCRQLRGVQELRFDARGRRSLKGVDEPIRIYAASLVDPAARNRGRGLPARLAGLARRRWVQASAAAALLLLVATQITRIGPADLVRRVLGPGEALPSIAVLPFENMSGDSADAFFSAGIHEDVMTQLYRLGGMKVISRTSVMQYRGTRKPIRTVASELGVATVLEASLRRSGSRVRIDARLIDAETEAQVWVESYDREIRDVLALQAEIAQQIARALHARLSPASISHLAAARTRPVNPEMYEMYLRGLHAAGQGDPDLAIRTLRRAIAIDSSYAPAFAALARSYYSQAFFGELAPLHAFIPMREAATRALQLDPTLSDGYAALALYHLHFDWEWETADRLFTRGLELGPNHAQVRHDYAHYLLAMGRVRESVVESERAAELDPGNSMLRACAGWHGFTDHEYADAARQAQSALMMMPGAFWPELILGWSYQHQGRHREAVAALRRAVASSGGASMAVASLASAQAAAGERAPAEHLLAELVERSDSVYVSAYDVAVAHAGLGEADEAFRWLRRAAQERSAMLVNIGWDPRFDPLRGDPRFSALITDLGLPTRRPPRPAAQAAEPEDARSM